MDAKIRVMETFLGKMKNIGYEIQPSWWQKPFLQARACFWRCMRKICEDLKMTAVLENLLYKMIYAAFTVLGAVPKKTAVAASNMMGRIWFAVDRRHRKVAIHNLTLAFGKEMGAAAIRRMARRNFCNLSMILFEIGWSMRFKKADVNRYFRIYGIENLQSAVKTGNGVLVLTAHIGNWELLIMLAAMIGFPMSAIYRPLDFEPLDRFFITLRSRFGARMHPKARAMRKVLRSLKEKELVGILLDQNTGVQAGVFADFFGKPACTNKGLALLARETQASVIPAFLVREGDGFRAEFGSMIPLIKTADKAKDIEANTARYNQVLEAFIRRYPEQWFWVHRRWKTRPPGAESEY